MGFKAKARKHKSVDSANTDEKKEVKVNRRTTLCSEKLREIC